MSSEDEKMRSRNNGGETGRKADGTFAPGNPGRPKGARHKATLACEDLLDGEAEALTRRCVDLALAGDTTALRLCIDRIVPVRKGRPISFEIPEMTNSGDVRAAALALLRAVAAGEVTPEEAGAASPLVELVRRTIETDEIMARLEALEAADKGRRA